MKRPLAEAAFAARQLMLDWPLLVESAAELRVEVCDEPVPSQQNFDARGNKMDSYGRGLSQRAMWKAIRVGTLTALAFGLITVLLGFLSGALLNVGTGQGPS